MNGNTCCIESCDMFDFMSNYVGRKVLHPGGVSSTDKLIGLLNINENKKVLDIACGKGLTSIYLAKKYGCRVVGIDILEKSIEEANYLSNKNGVSHLASFKVADASNLPFPNNEFDTTLSQAVLVLVKNKAKVIEEAVRVLKPGGRFGWIEISWKKQPPIDFINAAQKDICAICISNVETYQGWGELFRKNGIKELAINEYNMKRSMRKMIEDEGIINGLRIVFTYLTNSKIRKRMTKIDRFFKVNSNYIGYGIYVGLK
jgi:ubiquinone/menaquinone biosynthesis C-methylase UbiE